VLISLTELTAGGKAACMDCNRGRPVGKHQRLSAENVYAGKLQFKAAGKEEKYFFTSINQSYFYLLVKDLFGGKLNGTY
jgi:hypothetical protein